MKVVITGGVAGGATAAARIRRLDEKAEITVYERTGYVSYANCGLPYYAGGVIEDSGELTLQTPESFYTRFRVKVLVHHEVTEIDRQGHRVLVRDLETGNEFYDSYDRLLLAPGAAAFVPDVPGADLEGIYTLKTVEDALAVRKRVDDGIKSAVVVGGGFIGIEAAENLKNAGINVTVVQLPSQLMNTLDRDMASFVHAEMRKHGVKVLLGRTVTGFEKINGNLSIMLDGGCEIRTDMVIMAAGVRPESGLAVRAGLETGVRGSIAADEHMRTSDKDIYAVGDAVEVKHSVLGKKALVSLAGPANRQARIAADNICGIDSVYKGACGSSVIKIFDMTFASTGLTEKAAREAGYDCESIVLSPMSHAGYYPGGSVLTLKLVFEKGSMKILGAQAAGHDGADKRIDVIATAMQAGMKAPDLKDIDLAYAPPYSSVKDPVNMAGYIADNISRGFVRQFHYNEVEGLSRDKNAVLLDTRTTEEYLRGHADGFINIPVDELRERIGEIPREKPVYVMCQSGLRSYIACMILRGYGFDCYNFSGGYRFYSAVMHDMETADRALPCGMDAEHK